MGRPRFRFSEQQRKWVRRMAGIGLPHQDMACSLKITVKTLRRHFRKELTEGNTAANAQVLQTLYEMASSGKNTAATIFYLRTLGGLKETEASSGQDAVPPKIVVVKEK